jgi:hypothetical protein
VSPIAAIGRRGVATTTPQAPLTIAARPYRANGAPRWSARRATSRAPRVIAGKRSAAGTRPRSTLRTTSGSSSATSASKSPARAATRNASTAARCSSGSASDLGVAPRTRLRARPLEAGLRLLPITLAAFFFAPLAAKLGERLPLRILLGGGLAVVGGGLLVMHGLDADSE